jgi:ribulose-5-phosphate 4-epimerase/fuculose-1-phosphate aldolase
MAIIDDTTTSPGSIDGIPLTRKEVSLDGPPKFTNSADERMHVKQRLAGALRVFGKFGFSEGVAGHITVRDPEFPDHFWVNPFSMSFRQVKVSDLILVNHHGDVVYGKRPVNRAAFVLHSAVHAARPDINAAAHSHSVYGKAWSALGRTLDPITQDACAFYNDHSVITDAAGKVVFEIEDGERFAECFSSGKAAIHQNHGLFTAAETVDAAAYWFISMERSCQAQLLAEAAGTPKLIPHEWAQYTRDNTAHQMAGWLNFQPLWDDICLSDPDLFD